MEQPDPTIIMLDQLMRVLLTEAIRASIWATVFSLAWTIVRRRRG